VNVIAPGTAKKGQALPVIAVRFLSLITVITTYGIEPLSGFMEVDILCW
jgi:hypothetical protein